MSQVKVQWVQRTRLCDIEPTTQEYPQQYVSVIPLAALAEVVEGLKELPHKEGCAVLKDLLDGGPEPCSCPKRLLAMLEEIPKQDSGSNK